MNNAAKYLFIPYNKAELMNNVAKHLFIPYNKAELMNKAAKEKAHGPDGSLAKQSCGNLCCVHTITQTFVIAKLW